MPDALSLTGPVAPPLEGDPNRPEQLVIFCHGVGADGQDLIGLAPYFQQVLPRALFVAPNAPERFDMAPFGYQWFSLQDISAKTRWEGTSRAAPVLNAFINELQTQFDVTDAKTALIGFSQGTMMSLHVGLRRPQPLAGILGYSGWLTGPEHLSDDLQSRPPVRLIHGEADDVLSIDGMVQAHQTLEAAGVPVESFRRPGLGHGIDQEGVRLGMEFLSGIFATQ